MRDNISLIFAVLFAVFVLIILPLLSVTSRQDSISYNKVLTLTTNFVDDIRTKGYLTEEDYTNYLVDLSSTSNTYKVEMEYHQKFLIKNVENTDEYVEDTMIYYNKYIVDKINHDDGIADDEDVLRLAVDDEFYVKVYNTNITTASLLYNFFARVSIPEKIINIGYGGKVSHSSGSNFTQTSFESAYTPTIILDIDESSSIVMTKKEELVWSGVQNDYIKKYQRYLDTENSEAKLVVDFTLSRFAKIGDTPISLDMFTSGTVTKEKIKEHIVNYIVLSGELGYTVDIDKDSLEVVSDSEEGLQLKGTIIVTDLKLEEGIYRTTSSLNVKAGLGSGNTGILSSAGSSEEIIITRPQPGITIRRTNEYVHKLGVNDSVEFEIGVSNIDGFLRKNKTYKLISVNTNEEIEIDRPDIERGELSYVATQDKYKLTLTINKLSGKFVGNDLKLVIETEQDGKIIKGDSDKFVYVNDLTEYNIADITYTGHIYKGTSSNSVYSEYTINQGEELKIKAKITLDNAIENETDKQRVDSMILSDLVLKNTTVGLAASTTVSITKSEVGNNYVEITFSIPNDKAGTNSYYLYNKEDESVKEDSFSVKVNASVDYSINKIEYVGYEYTGKGVVNNFYHYRIYEGESLKIKAKITLDKSVAGDNLNKQNLVKTDLKLKNDSTGNFEQDINMEFLEVGNDYLVVSFEVPGTLGKHNYFLVSKTNQTISAHTFAVERSIAVQNYKIEKIECDYNRVFCLHKEVTQLTFNVYMSEEVYKTDGLVEHIKNNIKIVLDENEDVNNFENYVKIEYKDLEVDSNDRKLLKVTYNVDFFKYYYFYSSLELDVEIYGIEKKWLSITFAGIYYAQLDDYYRDWVFLGQEILITERIDLGVYTYVELEKFKEYFMKHYGKKNDSNPIFESIEIKDIRGDGYDFYIDYAVKITESSEYAGEFGNWIRIRDGELDEQEAFAIKDIYFDTNHQSNVAAYIDKERLFVEFDFEIESNGGNTIYYSEIEDFVEKATTISNTNYNIELIDVDCKNGRLTLEFIVLDSGWKGQSVNGNISIGNLDLNFTAKAVEWIWDSFGLHTEWHMYRSLYFDYEIEGLTKDEIKSYIYSIIKFNKYSDDRLDYWLYVYDGRIDIDISSDYEGAFTLFVGSRRFEYDSDSGFEIKQ